ncbi:MAG: MG2 domain-containing protein [Rubrivivax sp.]
MPRPLTALVAALAAGISLSAFGARVVAVSPEGKVADPKQVSVRFDRAVVPAGDPRLPAPFTLRCEGQAVEGDARWASDRVWLFDFKAPLPAGRRCVLAADPAWKPLDGALEGTREFSFASAPLAVQTIRPFPGARIDEQQQFLLRFNGDADARQAASAWCEVQGLGERIPAKVIEGAPRNELLRSQHLEKEAARWLLVGCERSFPADTAVRLVWGRRFEWKTRAKLTAEFSCERERASAPCMPLRPMTLRFSAPVARAAALAARLVPLPGQPGKAVEPKAEPGDFVSEIQFAAPLPENQRLRLTLPAMADEAGRALANAASFPLEVATGPLPPLAKFAGGAVFGIVEAGPEAMLPLTLRQVQADLQGATTGGQVRVKRLDASTPDAELMRWVAKLAQLQSERWESRELTVLAAEPDARRTELPRPAGGAPQAPEVIGLPLPQPGYHVVEVESRILGTSLLAKAAPMYVRTGVLVTNLGVHFKRGRSSSLVWVTTLDRGRPVAGAKVAVNDCRGRVLWNGSTGADGVARIDRGFDDPEDDARCVSHDGPMVSARLGADVAFVYGGWAKGIEPWRFNLAAARGATPDRRAHTVFDRTLVRAGETVSMKHYVRDEVAAGLALPAADTLPDAAVITHVGSGAETVLPITWPRGARAAEGRWAVPANAKLGLYDVALKKGDKRWPSGSLRVEAFRVPLVDARLALPAAPLVAPKSLALDAQLDLNAGGPLPNAPLKLSALLRPATVSFPGRDDYSFQPPRRERAAPGDDAAEDHARLVADRLAAKTDAKGAARITLADLPALEGPTELVTELGFDDPAGEVQTVSRRATLWPAALVVGVRTRDWAAVRGAARFSALVLDTDGRPQAGRAVEVVGRLHNTLSVRKRTVGGFYAYDNQHQVKELGALCQGKTDAQGRLDCEAALDAPGEVELIARAADDAGRRAEAAATVWVSGRGELWFEQDNDDRIDLLPEKREVEPGETARLQVRMPFRDATALVSVEREGIVEAHVQRLSGRDPVIELQVPKGAASWAPNVYVSVLVLRGRLRDAPWWSIFTWGWRDPADWWRAFRYEGQDYKLPTAMVDLSKPAFKLGVAELQVGLAEHRLDVKVTPAKEQYGVRETVKTRVAVTRGGQPVANAEVAFAAVDEGLLALAPNGSWNLLEGLMQSRPWGVETATAQGEIVGRRHYGRKALPPGGGGGRNPTRELFDTLLLWRGTVALDAKGEAEVDVPLNDSLTSFRLVAVADDGGQRFGTGSASVRVSQDLQMLPGLPPLVREGDRFDAGFTLRNTTTKPMTVKATLAGPGPALAPQTVMLAAGAAAEVKWPVQVPEGSAKLEWTASAEDTGGSARDRVKVVQAVQPAVPVRVWQATLQPLEGSVTIPLAAPAGALPNRGGVRATLQPKLSGALPGLKRFFEGYPYSCLEQKASKAIALGDAAAWSALGNEVAGYLDRDGLANYFPPRPEDPPRGSDRLTAYLLSAAHEAGLAWPDAAREAMLQGLAAFAEGRLERRFAAPRADLGVRRLAALEALSRFGRVQPRQFGVIEWTPALWPTASLLDAWSLLERVADAPDRAARLDEVQRLLRARLVQGGTTLRFTTEDSDGWWWLMDSADGNAARLVLAATASPAWKDDVPLLVNGTLARQKGGAWSTTTANLWGVLALQRFGQRFESQPVAGRSTLALGATSRSVDWTSSPEGASELLPWGPALAARHEGSGRPWLSVQALAAVPLTQPVAAGYRITKTATVTERKAAGQLSRGDIVRVRLEIEAVGDMAWVVVSDPVPAGAALLGGGLGRDSAIATRGEKREGSAWLAFEERAADAWRGYYEWLPRGRHVVEYTLRLNATGRFALPPTRVEAMYAPETFGERPNDAVEVKP